MGQLNLYSNATGSPAIVSLSGIGVGPAISVSANSLSFPAEIVGTNSAPQTLSLKNNGNSTAQILGISLPSSFNQTNTCRTSLAPGSTCTISVTFAPASGGTISGTLEITTDALPSALTISLSGTGEDYSLTPASGSNTTATVAAGQTAVFDLVLSSAGGLTGTANLSCTRAPANAVCSVSPSSGSLANSLDVAVSVTTAGSAGIVFRALPKGIIFTVPVCFLVLVFGVAMFRQTPFETLRQRFVLAVVVISVCFAIFACGGGSHSGAPSTPQGPPNTSVTPTGNYTLIVTAAYSNINRTIALTLHVD